MSGRRHVLAYSILPATLLACFQPTVAAQDWLIIPETRIGPISQETSASELTELLGAGGFVLRPANMGEGFCALGALAYAGTADSVEILWVDSTYQRPSEIRVRGDSSRWQTPAGVRVGSTVKELESLLGGSPVSFMGFGWDYGGNGSWQEVIDGDTVSVGFYLRPDRESQEQARADPRYREIIGDRVVSSDHPLIRSMSIHVGELRIRWAYPEFTWFCAEDPPADR